MESLTQQQQQEARHVGELRHSILSQEHTITKLRQELQSQEDQSNSKLLQEQVNSLQAQITVQLQETMSLRTAVAPLQAQLTALQCQLSSAQQSQQFTEAQLQACRQQLEEQSQLMADKSQELQLSQQTHTDTSSQLAETRAELKVVSTQLKEAQKELQRYKSQLHRPTEINDPTSKLPLMQRLQVRAEKAQQRRQQKVHEGLAQQQQAFQLVQQQQPADAPHVRFLQQKVEQQHEQQQQIKQMILALDGDVQAMSLNNFSPSNHKLPTPTPQHVAPLAVGALDCQQPPNDLEELGHLLDELQAIDSPITRRSNSTPSLMLTLEGDKACTKENMDNALDQLFDWQKPNT